MKTLLILAALALALAGPEVAGKTTHTIGGVEWRELTPAEVKMIPVLTVLRHKRQIPPARFDYFNPNVKIIRAANIANKCAELRTKMFRQAVKISAAKPLACAVSSYHVETGKWVRDNGTCTIVLPKNSPYLAILMRHEMGHCARWPSNHPD